MENKVFEQNRDSIIKEIDNLLPEYTAFLSDLVKFNSAFGNEKEAQNFVKSKMDSLGLKTEIFYSRPNDQSMNLVSRIKGSDSNNYNSLALNAHCDITPVDTPQRWQNQPFSGKIIDNILYGRGSQDDKAGIAIIMLIVNILKNLKINLKGDLIIESVIEDETTGNGSKTIIDNGITADGTIIVDGTWPERIIYAHLGQIWINAEITGEPVAACVEQKGINPIYIGLEFIENLKSLIKELNDVSAGYEAIKNPFFVNTGSFHSGVWHGSVPSSATVEMQIGFSGKYLPDEIFEMVNQTAKKVSDRISIKQSILKTPTFKTNPHNKLITELKSIIENNSQKEVLVVPVTGHCDMRHFKTQNICLYGPGGGKNAHGIDEFYYLDHMPVVTKNLLQFVLNWCNIAK